MCSVSIFNWVVYIFTLPYSLEQSSPKAAIWSTWAFWITIKNWHLPQRLPLGFWRWPQSKGSHPEEGLCLPQALGGSRELWTQGKYRRAAWLRKFLPGDPQGPGPPGIRRRKHQWPAIGPQGPSWTVGKKTAHALFCKTWSIGDGERHTLIRI